MAPAQSWADIPTVQRCFDASASIVLIGVPGAGKRTLGFIGATHLRRRLLTENRAFEAATGFSKAVFLEQHGRDALLTRSVQVLEQMLEQNGRGCVIECGASSLTSNARRLLTTYALTHPVVHVVRSHGDVPPSRSSTTSDAIKYRQVDSGHRRCSNFEFFNLFDDTRAVSETAGTDDFDGNSTPSSPLILQKVKLDFCHFLDSILGRTFHRSNEPFYNSNIHITRRHRSFATVWPLSALIDGYLSSSAPISGIDAIELSVDRWSDGFEELVSKHIASIRRHQNTSLIYSVDSKAPGMTTSEYWQAINHGVRLGCDCIVIDGYAPRDMQLRLLGSKGYAGAIAHFYFNEKRERRSWRHRDRIIEYGTASKLGYALVRQIQVATHRAENKDLSYFRNLLGDASPSTLPLVAYNAGPLGRSSKVDNNILTPVLSLASHEDVVNKQIAEGAVSVDQITKALFANFVYDPLQFYVFGSSLVDFSRTPVMYRAAFQMYGMSHAMDYLQRSTLTEVLDQAQKSTFGGAAVTFPFKESVFAACTQVSSHAAAIGSVNSIVPLRQLADERQNDLLAQAAERNGQGTVVGLYGDNTDWLGFYHNLRRQMSPRNAALSGKETALVLGAGGSARAAVYALISIGYSKIYIRNRTKQKAISLAEHFNEWCRQSDHSTTTIQVLNPIEMRWPEKVSLPTAIIACVPTNEELNLPDEWLRSPTGGVVAEVCSSHNHSIQLQTNKTRSPTTSASRYSKSK